VPTLGSGAVVRSFGRSESVPSALADFGPEFRGAFRGPSCRASSLCRAEGSEGAGGDHEPVRALGSGLQRPPDTPSCERRSAAIFALRRDNPLSNLSPAATLSKPTAHAHGFRRNSAALTPCKPL
jgi:hypothetical protein